MDEGLGKADFPAHRQRLGWSSLYDKIMCIKYGVLPSRFYNAFYCSGVWECIGT